VAAAPALPKKENWEDEEDATLTEAAAPAPAAAAAGPAAPESMKEKHVRALARWNAGPLMSALVSWASIVCEGGA
jgi:hypothetical protein